MKLSENKDKIFYRFERQTATGLRNEGNTDQMLFQFGILLLFPDLLPQMLGESFH